MLLGQVGLHGQELMDAYLEEEKKEEESYKRYREVLAGAAARLSGKLGSDVTHNAAEEFASSVPRWPAFDDTASALKELGSMGFKRYILSNVDDDLLEETISRHGLEVDGFVTAQQVGSYKPRPGHWTEFLRTTGAKKEEVLHVAQSIFHDVIPAGNLGIRAAWVNRYGDQLPGDAHPEYVADTLSGLTSALRQDKD